MHRKTVMEKTDWHPENDENEMYFMDNILVTCDAGYYYDGSHTIICGSNGK